MTQKNKLINFTIFMYILSFFYTYYNYNCKENREFEKLSIIIFYFIVIVMKLMCFYTRLFIITRRFLLPT